MNSAQDILNYYEMQAHPEGGFYRQTYKSSGSIPYAALPAPFCGDRVFSTAIVFLLRTGDYSYLHRIRQDEIWHFYSGRPLRLVMLSPEGLVSRRVLGHDLKAGQQPQYMVPAGYWFGASPLLGDFVEDYSFVACTVAPGFEFADFELAQADLDPFLHMRTDPETDRDRQALIREFRMSA